MPTAITVPDEFQEPGYQRVVTTVRLPGGEATASVYLAGTAPSPR